jgi:hypothetical protein
VSQRSEPPFPPPGPVAEPAAVPRSTVADVVGAGTAAVGERIVAVGTGGTGRQVAARVVAAYPDVGLVGFPGDVAPGTTVVGVPTPPVAERLP